MKLNNFVSKATPFYYFLDIVDYLAKKIWLEGNSGSITAILDRADLLPYFEDSYNPEEYSLGYNVHNLAGKFILVTGNNIPLRNISKFKFKIHKLVGVIQINYQGDGYKVIYGLQSGMTPTRHLRMHLEAQNYAIKRNPKHRVLIHANPTNLVLKTMSDHMDTPNLISYDLWNAMPHIMEFIPDGVGFIEESKVGVDYQHEIAKQFQDRNVVVRKYSGLTVAANNFDDAATIFEIIDKASNYSMKIRKEDWLYSAEFLKEQADNFGWDISEEILEIGRKPKPKD